jgi:tetratricopeptide (TPR) repeat protein
MDSYGWILFLLGKKNEALQVIQEAHSLYPDPEIAAHLGEVLWSIGNKEKAKQIFKDALKKSPANSILLETIQRLNAGI